MTRHDLLQLRLYAHPLSTAGALVAGQGDQIRRVPFRRFLEAEPPARLDRLDLLTAGDFAVVARKAVVLAEREPETLRQLLAAEVAVKPGTGCESIGFFK